MSAVNTQEATEQPLATANNPRMLNLYPLLGIVLILLVAAVAYGGLLVFLVEG